MPKVSGSGRERRRRERQAAANLRAAAAKHSRRVTYTAQYRRLRCRRFIGVSLLVVAGLVAVLHMFEHLGAIQLLPNPAMQDLLIGYPMAAVLAVGGLVIVGR